MTFSRLSILLLICLCYCSPKRETQASRTSSSDGQISETQTSIEWNEKRKLNWSDFKATSISKESNVAAVTSCGFGYKTNLVLPFSKPKFIVINAFYPEQSWVKKSEQSRPELLEHEQLHFDISEVYARRLRKALSLSKLNYFNLKKESERIFDKIHKDYLLRQETYENESAFSLNAKMQTAWQVQIREELNALNEYAK